jgi:hypothetical protein
MRRFMMTLGGTLVVLGSSLVASAQDKVPAQAPEKQAPMQAPMQAPKQAPMQAPTPVQKPVQAPIQKHAHVQSPVQKGEAPMKMAYRGGLFAGRFR